MKRFAVASMLTGVALILSYIEMLIPFSFGVPGFKMGLANLVIVFALMYLMIRDAACIQVVRILIIGAWFGNVFYMVFSLFGAVFSLGAMWLCKKLRFHIIVISMAGGIFHNIGQLVFAAFVLETTALEFYVPVALIAGFTTGLVIGVAVQLIGQKINIMQLFRTRQKS